jgi:CubicO group peptidase (beta-lactamase class C family)
MRALIAVMAILMTTVCCFAQEQSAEIQKRIQSVESGLVAINPPSVAGILSVGRDASAKRTTLSERMANYTVPGVSIAVINDYKIEWVKAYGVIRNSGDAIVTTETPFEAGSTTKFMTAVLVMRLVKEGKLDLDEDVNLKLKSWKVPENEFTAEHKVTLRLLLSHRAGISRPEGGFDYEEGSTPTLVQVLNGEAPATNKPAVVEFVPGSQHQYSNLGYLIIQQLIEDVTGRPYIELAQEMVFDKLGMKHSTLKFPLAKEVEKIAASPHDADGKAYDHWLHPTALAHGNLVTTPSDLSLLVIELMRSWRGESDRLLSQETVRQMFTSQMEFEPEQMFGFTGQGLGVFLLQDGENLYFSHPGHNEPGINCMFLANPATGQGAIVMTNGAKGLFLAMEILAGVVSEYGW